MDVKSGNVLNATGVLIVHGCNAQGVMGSGVAKGVRDMYPQAFAAYRREYEKAGKLDLGEIIPVQVGEDKWIVNAITQKFYGRDGKRYVDYDAVRSCFAKVGALAKETGLKVVYPLIGCDLGGGDWNVVSKIIDEELDGIEHSLFLLPGKTLPPPSDTPRKKAFGR